MPKKTSARKRGNVFSNFDVRVLIVLFFLLLAGLLFWLFKMKNHVNCDELKITVQAKKYEVNEVITFEVSGENADNFSWDFGDNTANITDRVALHQYKQPGEYLVAVRVNNNCVKQQAIVIKNPGISRDPMKVPNIISAPEVSVGTPVNFKFMYNGNAQTFSWSFGETINVDSREMEPTYTFTKEGIYDIKLVINNDYVNAGHKTIFVKPKKVEEEKEKVVIVKPPKEKVKRDPPKDPIPPRPPIPIAPPGDNPVKDPEPEKAPDISMAKLSKMLYDVANQTKNMEDFEPYICTNYSLPVIINGKKFITFKELCDRIRGEKIKIDSVNVNRNNLNCITTIQISYKVRKMMIWTDG